MAAASAPRRAADTWARLTQTNPVVASSDALLRGTGQVMFQNNPVTGLLFLVGIFVNSAKLGGAGLLGLAASTLTAYLLGADRALIRNGLFGFNGILVGIGLAFFLEFDPLLVVYIMLGAAVSTIAMMALANFLGPWDMPALTAPFVLTAWLLLFAVYQFAHIRPSPLIAPMPLEPQAIVQTELRELPTDAGAAGLTIGNLAHGFFRGVGEVMFQDNLLTGVIFLLAILVNSRISAAFAAVGSALGLLTALALGGDGVAIYHGLYALVAAVFSTIVFAAIAVLLSPIGMPALTAPFVLVTWLFLLPKAGFQTLQPVALADVSTAENTRASYRVRGTGPGAASQPGEAT
jgi:urea transporter